jgi:hypothetical protein
MEGPLARAYTATKKKAISKGYTKLIQWMLMLRRFYKPLKQIFFSIEIMESI